MKAVLLRTVLVLGCWTCGVYFAIFLGGKTQPNPPMAVLSLAGAIALLVAAIKAFPDHQRRSRIVEMTGSLFLFAAIAAILAPVFASARRAESMTATIHNARALATSLCAYADDNDGRFPPAAQWRTVTERYRDPKENLRRPGADSPYGYAMNKALATKKTGSLDNPSETILIFETNDPNPNAAGGQELQIKSPYGLTYAFADGHAKRFNPLSTKSLHWTP